jgi:hypothetical protein
MTKIFLENDRSFAPMSERSCHEPRLVDFDTCWKYNTNYNGIKIVVPSQKSLEKYFQTFSNFSKHFQTFGNCPKTLENNLEKNGNLPMTRAAAVWTRRNSCRDMAWQAVRGNGTRRLLVTACRAGRCQAARLGHGGRRQFACRTGALGQVNYRQGGRS